jgi:uncharacterized protein YndB with AHSA1/START domain
MKDWMSYLKKLILNNMTTKNQIVSDTAEREIAITRILNAPKELVFEVWTDPKHLSEWWGPNGFTITIHEMDLRVGGKWLHTMHGPDGTDYPNEAIFTEIVKPDLIKFTHNTLPKFDVIVTFEAVGNKTKLTMRNVFETAEIRNIVAEKYGAVEGQVQTINRFEELLAKMSAKKELTFIRTFNAPCKFVWKAWTDPKQLAQWWGPHGFTAPTCEIDLKPGGALRIHMEHPDFPNHWMKGEFLEVTPPSKLVFTNKAFIGPGDNAGIEGITTVIFEEQNGKTRLTVAAEVTKLAPEFSFAYQGMNEGWNQSLDKLVALLNSLK